MANTRQDGSQGQRMFAALSAGFAANESALVNVEQFVSRCTSFGLPWWQAEPLLRALFVAFDKDFNGYIDCMYKMVCCLIFNTICDYMEMQKMGLIYLFQLDKDPI